MKQVTNRRLTDIEKNVQKITKFAPIIAAIKYHIYYDKLPKDEYRTLYCEYIGVDRKVFEEVNLMVLGDLHIMCEDIKPPPTPEELQSIIDELGRYTLEEIG